MAACYLFWSRAMIRNLLLSYSSLILKQEFEISFE